MPIPSTKFHPAAHCLMQAPPLSFFSVCGSHWVVLQGPLGIGGSGEAYENPPEGEVRAELRDGGWRLPAWVS